MRFFIFILFFLFFVGCAKQEVVLKEVLVPTKCDVPKRKKPAKNPNLTKYLTEILIYTEGLERDIAYCRGEK